MKGTHALVTHQEVNDLSFVTTQGGRAAGSPWAKWQQQQLERARGKLEETVREVVT